MATFVLVHGGGHGGWCYRRVARLLRANGHEVYCPTLTGLGERSHLLRPDIDLDTHIIDVVNLLVWEDLADVILAGHSYGGMVITGVADCALNRIGHLVYLDAALPRDGESLADLAPRLMTANREIVRVVDGVALTSFPDHLVANMGITDPDDRAWVRSKVTPHPWACYAQRLELADEAAVRSIPRTIVTCTPGLGAAEESADRRSRRADADRVWEIETGHDLMVTEPEAVARMLEEVAAGMPDRPDSSTVVGAPS